MTPDDEFAMQLARGLAAGFTRGGSEITDPKHGPLQGQVSFDVTMNAQTATVSVLTVQRHRFIAYPEGHSAKVKSCVRCGRAEGSPVHSV